MTTNKQLFPAIAAYLLGAIGGVSIVAPLLRMVHRVTPGHQIADSIHFSHVASLPIVGIVLLYLAFFVYTRRLLALGLAMVGVALLVGYESLFLRQTPATIVTLVLSLAFLVVAAWAWRDCSIKNNLEGIRQHVRSIALVMMTGFLYGMGGFLILGRPFFHDHISIVMAFKLTLDSIVGLSGTIAEPTKMGQLFIDSLGGIGIVIIVIMTNALFQPLRLRVRVSRQHDLTLAEQIVQQRGQSTEDFFKVWPHDKQYFFSQSAQSFIAYKQAGHSVIALGEPAGERSEWPQLIKDFSDYCRSLGWTVAVVNANQQTMQVYKHCGFSSFFIGNEAIVDTAQFVTQTRRDKHFRYVANKAARDHLVVEEWMTPNNQQMTQLGEISHEWLTRGGRREYTFFMGYFDPAYLRRGRVFVVHQAGSPVAFVNLIPTVVAGHTSIDMLRSRSNCSSVAMHFLLLQLLDTLQHEGIQTLNLGLSPLAGVSDDGDVASRAILRSIRFLGSSYYAFQGLEQFKNKFRPTWKKRWLLVSGAPANIIRISRDIEAASRYEPYSDMWAYGMAVIGVVVLTIGLYLLLG